MRGVGRRRAWVAAAATLLIPMSLLTTGAFAQVSPQRLPRLVVLPSPDLHVGTATSTPVVLGREVLFGCDPYESTEEGMQRCLRFDTILANVGPGALELRYDGSGTAGPRQAVQRIYRADGTHTDRAAGWFSWDLAHGHFHYADFAVASLWRSNAAGDRRGDRPVRTGRKDGFCLEDLGAYSTRASAKAYVFPDACYPTVQPDGRLTQVNGISSGWLDVYDQTLTNQSIEISGVRDGYYLLSITVDPRHTLRLATGSRRTSWQLIRLCGDEVDLVGRTHRGAAGSGPAPTSSYRLAWRQLCRDARCPLLTLGSRTGQSRRADWSETAGAPA